MSTEELRGSKKEQERVEKKMIAREERPLRNQKEDLKGRISPATPGKGGGVKILTSLILLDMRGGRIKTRLLGGLKCSEKLSKGKEGRKGTNTKGSFQLRGKEVRNVCQTTCKSLMLPHKKEIPIIKTMSRFATRDVGLARKCPDKYFKSQYNRFVEDTRQN